jgi:hypothetical protein
VPPPTLSKQKCLQPKILSMPNRQCETESTKSQDEKSKKNNLRFLKINISFLVSLLRGLSTLTIVHGFDNLNSLLIW